MMKCEEIQEHLGAYRDGELEGAVLAAVEAELASCAHCQGALRDLEAMSAMVERAVIEPAAAADLSGFADQVMARVEAEAPTVVRAQAAEPGPGLLDRLASLLGLDARALVMAGAMAAAALAWGLWPAAPLVVDDGAPSVAVKKPPAPKSAEPGEPEARPRRGMEMETASAGRNAASVQQVEVAHGRVEIDDNADDPDRPVVVWHIVGDEVEDEADVTP